MTVPAPWVMAMLFWIHMMATFLWSGSIAAMSLLVLPVSNRVLDPVERLSFVAGVNKRFEPIAWFCIAVLLVTGLFQMSLNPHYNGFLSTSTSWSLAILAKEALACILAAVTAYQTWEVTPAIQRLVMQKERAKTDQLEKWNRRARTMLTISLMLTLLILLATAIARVS